MTHCTQLHNIPIYIWGLLTLLGFISSPQGYIKSIDRHITMSRPWTDARGQVNWKHLDEQNAENILRKRIIECLLPGKTRQGTWLWSLLSSSLIQLILGNGVYDVMCMYYYSCKIELQKTYGATRFSW